jgi:hypothetical protein
VAFLQDRTLTGLVRLWQGRFASRLWDPEKAVPQTYDAARDVFILLFHDSLTITEVTPTQNQEPIGHL